MGRVGTHHALIPIVETHSQLKKMRELNIKMKKKNFCITLHTIVYWFDLICFLYTMNTRVALNRLNKLISMTNHELIQMLDNKIFLFKCLSVDLIYDKGHYDI
jgi:hypothetical protein